MHRDAALPPIQQAAPAFPQATPPSRSGTRSAPPLTIREGITRPPAVALSPQAQRVLDGAEALRDGQWSRCVDIHRPYMGE